MSSRESSSRTTMGDRLPRSGDGREPSDESADETVPRTPTSGDDVPELRLTVVEYEERPDRGTIHPPELVGVERMETWMSANTSVFVALSAWR